MVFFQSSFNVSNTVILSVSDKMKRRLLFVLTIVQLPVRRLYLEVFYCALLGCFDLKNLWCITKSSTFIQEIRVWKQGELAVKM